MNMAIHNPQVATAKFNGQRVIVYSYETTRNGLKCRIVQFGNGEKLLQTKWGDEWKDTEDFDQEDCESLVLRIESKLKD